MSQHSYMPHQMSYHHQQPTPSQIDHYNRIRLLTIEGNETRPPLFITGNYNEWKARFLQWLSHRPDADLMLRSIREGPYQMKFIATSTGITRMQTDADLSPTELRMKHADHQAEWFITLGLPNSIYMQMDCLTSAHDMWNNLEEMHCTKESQHIRMLQILESCFTKKFHKTILPAPASPNVNHAPYLQKLYHSIFDPQPHPATTNDHMRSILVNHMKLAKPTLQRNCYGLLSPFACFYTRTENDSDDDDDLQQSHMALMAQSNAIIDGDTIYAGSSSFMDDVSSDDENNELAPDTPVLMTVTTHDSLVSNSDPVYDTDGLNQVSALNHSLVQEIASPSSSMSNEKPMAQNVTFLSTHEDEQINTVVKFDDDQISTYVTFDDPIETDQNVQVEQQVSSNDLDLELTRFKTLLMTSQNQNVQIQQLNSKLKDKNALLTREIQCYKRQISGFIIREERAKDVEAAHVKESHLLKDLQNQLHLESESVSKLNAKLDILTFEHTQQLDQLNNVLSKTKTDLSNCQTEFSEHRKTSTEKTQMFQNEILALQNKIKESKIHGLTSNVVSVNNMEQINGNDLCEEVINPFPKQSDLLRFFELFMNQLDILDHVIEHHSQITVHTFTSPSEKERRNIFQKQLKPGVQNLRSCAVCWEQELQKEVKSMMNVFKETEKSISKHKRKNNFLLSEIDRLLEHVLNADIVSVIANSVYVSGESMFVEAHNVDVALLNNEIETLKCDNEMLKQTNDDVQNKLSKEIFQLQKKV